MNTRRATADSEFRQERYMSSAENERGLLANCVASRVRGLGDPAHRELIWWLQARSWQPGGLAKLAAEILARWPERFVTEGMEEIGFSPDRIYKSAEVKRARPPLDCGGERFLVRGENTADEKHDELVSRFLYSREERPQHEREQAAARPTSFPAAEIHAACIETARAEFADFLFKRLCLDPSISMGRETLWYIPRLVETLAELRDEEAARASASAPVTEIGAIIAETLEFAMESRRMVFVDGLARTGKTFAVKAWVAAHPGCARYAQVPATNDDIGFFRALCEALGLGSSRAYKAHDLRAKIEEVLQSGDLLLILDEGHYLLTQGNVRKAVPRRMNWVLTQLENMGVPVAVITTPQFTKSQEALVRGGGWSSEQLIGRIGRYKTLPDSLPEHDLEAVARHWLPGCDEKVLRMLVTYAQSSEKFLQGIESLALNARFTARKAGRELPTLADVAAALKDGVVPSDNALTLALATARGERRKPGRPAAAIVTQPLCRTPAKPVQTYPTNVRNSALEMPQRDVAALIT